MRKIVLLLAGVATALLLASGAALALVAKQCETYVPGTPGTPSTGQCYGTPEDDELLGTEDRNVMYGGKGGDTLRGLAGDDDLYGNRHGDTLLGGPGSDWLMPGNGRDATVDGGEDRDAYLFTRNRWGHDTLTDTVVDSNDYLIDNVVQFSSNVSVGLTINLVSDSGPEPEVKNATGDSTINWSGNVIDRVSNSSSGSDHITGNDATNRIYSVGDNDSPTDDTINSIGGDDINVVDDNFGGDTVDCGEGANDVVYYDSDDTVTNCEIHFLDGVRQP